MVKSLKNLHTVCSTRFIKFTWSIIIITSVFGIVHFLTKNYENAFIDLSAASLFFINLKIPKNYHSCSHKIIIFNLIGVSLLIYLLLNGGTHRTGWLWVLVFPAFIFLLDSKQKGVKWVTAFAMIIFMFNIAQYFHWLETAYTHEELFILLVVYGLIAYLLYLFKKEIQYYSDQLRSINSVLEKKIEVEIEKNKQKDVMLNNQSKQAQMGEMISMIAHQWRQPLNAISAASINLNLQNTMGILDSQSLQESTLFIQRKTQEMSEVIDTFIEFVKPNIQSKDFYPKEAIEKVMNIIGSQLHSHNITVEIENNEWLNSYPLHGIINLFEQIILNLMLNTRDAFDEQKIQNHEKKILFYSHEKGIIVYEDNAGGIPIEIQDKVFNPYFTTKEPGKGTGLGLYMCKDIIKKHFKGELIYQSIEGGSRFILRFPHDRQDENLNSNNDTGADSNENI